MRAGISSRISVWAVATLASLATVTYYVRSSGDAFLFDVLLSLPILVIADVVLAVATCVVVTTPARLAARIGLGMVLPPSLLLPVLLVFGAPLKDEVWFAAWVASHSRKFQEAKSSDMVLEHWDAWGFAGLENDSFLVSDTANALSEAVAPRTGPTMPAPQAAVAERWRQDHHLACEIARVQQVWRGFYLVTTFNCGL